MFGSEKLYIGGGKKSSENDWSTVRARTCTVMCWDRSCAAEGTQMEQEFLSLASGNVHVDNTTFLQRFRDRTDLRQQALTEHANLFLLFVFNHEQTTP